MDALTGHLLLASPEIEHGPFWRSVVYVLDHNHEGAVGVIINRPMDADIDDVLPEWSRWTTTPSCLFEGGPVALDSALAVGVLPDGARTRVPDEGWKAMRGRVGLVDLDGPMPEPGQFEGLRIFAGYAGWTAGQLEDEIAGGSWLVVPAVDTDLVTMRPEALWVDVLRRQDDELRFWATFPGDPTLN